MDCPYCFEEIDDRAIACGHCGRGLEFFRPVMHRIAALEDQQEALRESFEKLVSNLGSRAPALREVVGLRTSAFFVLWILALTAVFDVVFWALPSPLDLLALLAAHGSAFPMGLWMGFRLRGYYPRVYATIGATAGAFQFATVELVDRAVSEHRSLEVAGDWFVASLLTMLIGLVLFTAGGTFGALVARRLSAHKGEASVLGSLAARGEAIRARRIARGKRRDPIAVVGSFVTAIAPVLAFAGTIAAAYLGRPYFPQEDAKPKPGRSAPAPVPAPLVPGELGEEVPPIG